MSSNKTKTPLLSLRGFRGVDSRSCKTDNQVADDIVNFRILNNGSLEKRSGYRLLSTSMNPIRAIQTAFVNGKKILYALAGAVLISVDPQSGVKTVHGSISTTEGNACMFFYNHTLYLMDELNIYQFKGDEITIVSAYIPLIGKDWDNNVIGEPYEPKNILTRKARISYVVSSEFPTIFMRTGEPIESVEAVYLNGVLLEPDRYYIDEEFETVNVTGVDTGDRIEIFMTMKESMEELRALFLSATRSILFSGSGAHRLFFWGGVDPSLMFCTSYVTEERQLASARQNGSGNDLYVPRGYEFRVSAGGYRIQGCACHYDRLLIFTEGETWMATPDASGLDEFSVIAIDQEIGCAAPDGVVAVGNHPISLGRHSLYQWERVGDVPNRCRAHRISEEIDERLRAEDYSNSILHYDLYRNELWVCNKESGNAWICNLSIGAWYRFTNIFADRFFDADGRVGFIKDKNIYVFDDGVDRDQIANSQSNFIYASYRTDLTDFGNSDQKILSYLETQCESGDGSMEVLFYEENTAKHYYPLFLNLSDQHVHLRHRTPTGRFRTGRLEIQAPAGGRPTVHGISLYPR